MTMKKISTLLIGLIFFSTLCGFRGCEEMALNIAEGVIEEAVEAGVEAGAKAAVGATVSFVASPFISDGPVYVDSDYLYAGDIELAVYAPSYTDSGAVTETYKVIIREGSVFGPTVLNTYDYGFDVNGVGILDINDLPYGYYDMEIIGLDYHGNTASYASMGFYVDSSFTNMDVALESI